jgi:hypothetical protein
VRALLESAEQELRAGRPEQSAVLLERALRIEPHNAAVWYSLGRARLEQGDYAQAEALAAKSHSLGAADRKLRERNAGLTAIALESSGKSVAEMNQALQRFAARQRPVAEITLAGAYVANAYANARDGDARQAGAASRGDAVAPRGRLVRIPGWRRLDDALNARVRRQREARRVN